jgi:hypothetical protein
MKAARWAPALCGGKPNDLAAGTTSHQLNSLQRASTGRKIPKTTGNPVNIGSKSRILRFDATEA